MSTDGKRIAKVPRLERLLAKQLHYGTWLASAVTAFGIILALVDWQPGPHGPAALSGMSTVTAGVALFILLPVLRLVLMFIVFQHERDYLFSMITALVLLIIGLGLVLGLYLSAQP
jgi:uncharacterized membrane protein